jgi:hypothetical protein
MTRKIHFYRTFNQTKPAVTLVSGDVFKARGGPYYRTAQGAKIDMGAAGTYKFHQLCRQGARLWIEAWPLGGGALERIYVGKKRHSKIVGELILAPHRISKMRTSTVEKVTGKARRRARRKTKRGHSGQGSSATQEVPG